MGKTTENTIESQYRPRQVKDNHKITKERRGEKSSIRCHNSDLKQEPLLGALTRECRGVVTAGAEKGNPDMMNQKPVLFWKGLDFRFHSGIEA